MKSAFLSLLMVLSVAACSASDPAPPSAASAAPAAPALAVDSARVETRDLQRNVEAIGTLDPNEEVSVVNQVEGSVLEILVDLGDAVRKGQLLATLDTRELELAVRQQAAALQQDIARLGIADPDAAVEESSTSQVQQAEATLAEARIRLDRTKRLAQEGVLPQQQLDEQQSKHDVAGAAVKSARESVRNIKAAVVARKAGLEFAQKKLADARIVAPMGGLVRERLVSEGAYLKANSPIITIVQTSPLKLRLEVPETAIESVKVGRSVQFTVDSFPGRVFEGRISRIAPLVDRESRTLKLEALVDNASGALRPGLFARATILTGRTEKSLVAPPGALFVVAGLEKVFAIQDGKVTERIVRTGARGEGFVEIVEGVKEGDLLAASNLGSLQQGREVIAR